jgi:two-component system, LytTR family, sensor histidine kinase AlgZ
MGGVVLARRPPELILSEQKTQSIRQNDLPDALPDFRNLGVISRILIAVNAIAAFAALVRSHRVADFGDRLVEIAGPLEPVLLIALVILYAASPWLARLAYGRALACVLAIVLAVTAAVYPAQALLGVESGWPELSWSLAYAAAATALLAWYFHLRQRAFSPALAEARLQALQARIRPHFLFNSLNAVLSLIRNDPRRAETAIEDLAELFRTVMSDNRRLTLLADEVSLCRQYLSLEELRLGERLRVEWHVDPAAGPALVPPMLLQPLIENAIYHGIEPGIEPGVVEIRAERDGDRLRLQLSNPYHPEHQHRQGNRMALANIRERLLLHFDVEARLDTRIAGARYEIDIMIPYRAAAA